ncbi:MAG: M1 family metallopeptidase, partial [Litorilinea sp.]
MGTPFLIGPLLLVFLVGLLSACGAEPAAAPDAYAAYRPAVKPAFQADFDLLQGAPRYDLTITMDPSGNFITGTGQILVTNYTGDSWRTLVFRLYPMLEQYGTQMTIRSVLLDGQAATFEYLAENTAMRIELPTALPSGEALRVQLAWRVEVPRWSDNPNVYALFGRSQFMTSLPLFYPSLAVYEPGATVGTGKWWLETGSVRGDAAFNLTSLFVVTATLPADEVPITSGALITSTRFTTENGDAMARHVWATGPVREFLLHTSPQFSSATVEAYGTQVSSYWLPGQEAAGRNALRYAVAALRIFSDHYGEYPFTHMHVAPAPLSFRGMEYPQVNLVGIEVYTRFQNSMEVLVAHEVAHQWWYQLVHNDPVNTPWLDEALAEYSVKLYYEGLRGDAVAQQLQRQRWLTPVTLWLQEHSQAPIDRPVATFASGTEYETVVYGRGALLYDTMRTVLGERAFRRYL